MPESWKHAFGDPTRLSSSLKERFLMLEGLYAADLRTTKRRMRRLAMP